VGGANFVDKTGTKQSRQTSKHQNDVISIGEKNGGKTFAFKK